MSNARKQVPLRLSIQLYHDLAAWAEDDFRSVNGQIEYLLTQCVLSRKKGRTEKAGQAKNLPQPVTTSESDAR